MASGKIDWQDHVTKQASSGMSVKRYCDSQRLSLSAFYAAKKRLGIRPADFIPVVIADQRRDDHLTIRLGQDGCWHLEGRMESLAIFQQLLGRAS